MRYFIKLVAILVINLFVFAALVSAQQETRHTLLIMDRPAGAQISKITSEGIREYDFEFNDRGSGPKTKTRIRLDGDGIPVLIEIAGNNYLKAPVAEKFSIADGVAHWKNTAEQGEKRLAAKAFYVSMNGAPEEMALLAQALLKSPTRRLPLLPAGEAAIERAGELTLKDGDKTRRVAAYQISGLGFTPSIVWLDEDGVFFALAGGWYSVIRQGWEASAPVLLKAQDEHGALRYGKLARALTRKPTKPLVFINVNLFDAEAGKMLPNSTVVVEGNRIKAVGTGKKITVPKNAETIDAKGKTLMPGLWDMHAHIFPNDGLLNIAAGVTTVRDLANDSEQLLALKKKFEGGEEIGPRILMAGFMDGRGATTGPTKVFVDTEAEAQAAIENYFRLGYTGIKVYNLIKSELVPKIIELARSKGLRVSGHVPNSMTATQFVNAGADEIQHINHLFRDFVFDEVNGVRTRVRGRFMPRAATVDLTSEEVSLFIKLLKNKGIVVDPTVNLYEGRLTDRPGTIATGFAPIADRLPPQVRRGLLEGGWPVPEGKDEEYRNSAKALLRMIKLLYDAGVPIVAGTDSLAGFALHRELELYVEAGIPANEVLKIATIGAARIMKRDGELGSVAPGKLADLILVDGDPATRISDIRRVSLVVKDGNIYVPAALYKNIGVSP